MGRKRSEMRGLIRLYLVRGISPRDTKLSNAHLRLKEKKNSLIHLHPRSVWQDTNLIHSYPPRPYRISDGFDFVRTRA